MRTRNFGFIAGGALATLGLRLAVVMLAGVGYVVAKQAPDAIPAVSATPLNAEQLAVYRAVLHGWMDDGKSTVNLSVLTVPLDRDGPLGDKSCGKDLDLEPLTAGLVHRFRPQDLPQIGSDKLRLVDPDLQEKEVDANDPSKKIREGASVDDAVSNGFAHGLATLSEIQFDKRHTHAIVWYGFHCGALCGNGGTVILEKKDGAWSRMSGRKGVCSIWMSSTVGRDSTSQGQ